MQSRKEESQRGAGRVPRRGAARRGRGPRARETDAMEQAAEGAMTDRDGVSVEFRRWWKERSEGLRLWGVSGGEVVRVALSSTRRAAVGTRKSRGGGRATHLGGFGRGAPVDQVWWLPLPAPRSRRAAAHIHPRPAALPRFGRMELERKTDFYSRGHPGPC